MSFETSCTDIRKNPCKGDFPLLATHKELCYLDSAATAQRPACVLDAEREFYETMNANPLRGLYSLSLRATDAINECRSHIARFIGADSFENSASDIIFSRNTSEALNMLASSLGSMLLKPGDEVLISIMEHHSNLIPWQKICRRQGAKLNYMYCDLDGTIPQTELDKITPATKIVSITQISNVLGIQTPVQKIASIAHENGALLVVDGAQSVPHIHVNVAELGCDFFAFSAHKVFGPFGIGVLWGKHELLEKMPVFLCGGEMIDSVTEQDAVWAELPEKFEAGTQDACGIYATGVALSYLESLGIHNIEAREQALMRYLVEELSKLDYIEFVGPKDPARHYGAVSFNVKGIHPHDVSYILADEQIAIRAGHHCAQPLLNYLGLRSCCRASLSVYNDAKDIDTLIRGLEKVWRIFHGE